MADNWEDVGAAADVQDDMPLTTKLAGKEIGVYLVDGEYHAMEDVCPHAYALLSQGFVMEKQVECPLHGARWEIVSGRLTAEPGVRNLKKFDCKVENGRVLVRVP